MLHTTKGMTDVHLNDIWTLHFHDPNNEDWNLTSYFRLSDVSTVVDFGKVHTCVKDKLKSGMFFLMREHIFPCWDDENNVHGGCLSIKVPKDNVVQYWEELCFRVLGETLMTPDGREQWDVVNGISISPKRYFCIIKLWLRTGDFNDKKYFRLPENHYGEIIYKDNMDNIQRNHDSMITHPTPTPAPTSA